MLPTYQVSEVSADHKLQGFCRAGGVACDHRVTGHDLCHGGRTRVKRFGSHLHISKLLGLADNGAP